MTDNIIVGLVVAIAGAGSLAVVVGKIFGRIIDRMLTLFGNHMTEIQQATKDNTVALKDSTAAQREAVEKNLACLTHIVQTCNETAKMWASREK